jgi:hypothetical protein
MGMRSMKEPLPWTSAPLHQAGIYILLRTFPDWRMAPQEL